MRELLAQSNELPQIGLERCCGMTARCLALFLPHCLASRVSFDISRHALVFHHMDALPSLPGFDPYVRGSRPAALELGTNQGQRAWPLPAQLPVGSAEKGNAHGHENDTAYGGSPLVRVETTVFRRAVRKCLDLRQE